MEASATDAADQAGQPTVCQQCGGTDLQRQTVRSAFWHDDRLVVVQGIPALVCGQCHEQYFDDGTVVLIDRLRGQGFPADQAEGEIRVPIFSLGMPAKK